MGRGCGWSDTELARLKRAWVHESEDSVSGIDQTAARFRCTMFVRFKELAQSDDIQKTYFGRTGKSVRAKIDKIAADVQKFRDPFCRARACNPTGVNKDEVINMEISVQLPKHSSMDYDALSFPQWNWRNHLSFRMLALNQKFSDEGKYSSVFGTTGNAAVHVDIEEGEGLYSAAPDGRVSDQGTPQFTETAETSSETTDTVKEEDDSIPRPRRRKSALRMQTDEKHR